MLDVFFKKYGLTLAFLAFLAASPQAQESALPVKPAPAAGAATAGAPAARAAAAAAAIGDSLPRSFRQIKLGMGLDELKAALAADDIFAFRGDRDVSLLSNPDQALIETTGFSFVRRAFFQLRGGKLFMMAFDLDAGRVDHYSVFSALVADYGEPSSLDPRESVWLSENTRVSLERPLTVKYLDRIVFDELTSSSRVKESRDAVLRKEFLDGF